MDNIIEISSYKRFVYKERKGINTPRGVRVSFFKKNSTYHVANIYIPKKLANKIGIKNNKEKILIYENDNRVLFIKKNKEGNKNIYLSGPNIFKLQVFSIPFIPTEDEMKLHPVKHEFYDEGIKIYV